MKNGGYRTIPFFKKENFLLYSKEKKKKEYLGDRWGPAWGERQEMTGRERKKENEYLLKQRRIRIRRRKRI